MKFVLNKGFISQLVDDRTLIFDSETSQLYSFNESAHVIFKGIKKGSPISVIEKSLVKKYHISEEQARSDISSFIDELIRNKIIKEQEGSA